MASHDYKIGQKLVFTGTKLVAIFLVTGFIDPGTGRDTAEPNDFIKGLVITDRGMIQAVVHHSTLSIKNQ